MKNYGFAAEVQEKTLRNGRCLVRPATLATVFGYVPTDSDNHITVTLTDGRDCSPWQVQLTITGKERCAVTGLKPWLEHRHARVGDIFKIEADGTRYLASLEHKDGVAAGQDADPKESAAQDSLAIDNSAPGEHGRIALKESARPNAVGPFPDRRCALTYRRTHQLLLLLSRCAPHITRTAESAVPHSRRPQIWHT